MTETSIKPSGWSKATLQDIAIWGSGGTPSRKVQEYFTGNIPWVKTGELVSKFIYSTEEQITPEAIQNSSAKIFPKGSVTLAMYGATIGKASIFGIDAACNQACAVGKTDRELFSNQFLYYYLVSEKRNFIKRGKGGAQPNISQGLIKEWPILVPPLNEQTRIVEKIEELFSELDKGVESLKTAQQQLKVYRQTLLKQAFEGKLTEQWRKDNPDKVIPAERLLDNIQAEREARYQQQLDDWKQAVKDWEAAGKEGKKPAKPRMQKELPPLTADELAGLPSLPVGWFWVRTGSMNIGVSDGPFGSHLKTGDYVGDGVRVVRLENIGPLYFDESKRSFITEEKYQSIKKHTVHAGDIIFSSFIADNIRVTVIPESISKAVNKADCFCIRPHGNMILNGYLTKCLSTRITYSQLAHQVHGATRPRINTTQLKHCIVPITSLTEQCQVDEFLETNFSLIEQLESDIETNLKKSEALRQSILKKAFSGQLVPQDPNDEPASELLARIRTEREAAEQAERQAKAAAKKTASKRTPSMKSNKTTAA